MRRAVGTVLHKKDVRLREVAAANYRRTLAQGGVRRRIGGVVYVRSGLVTQDAIQDARGRNEAFVYFRKGLAMQDKRSKIVFVKECLVAVVVQEAESG